MNEWIKHDGGERPVLPEVVVEVRYSNGCLSGGNPARADNWHWKWVNFADGGNIAEYRIISPKPQAEAPSTDDLNLLKGILSDHWNTRMGKHHNATFVAEKILKAGFRRAE